MERKKEIEREDYNDPVEEAGGCIVVIMIVAIFFTIVFHLNRLMS